MKKLKYIFYILIAAVALTSCDDYVTGVDPLIDKVQDDLLTSEAQMGFVINGVWNKFALTYDQTAMLMDGLSDQTFFDRDNPDATYMTYDDIDQGEILPTNNTLYNIEAAQGEMRFYADRLLERVAEITFEDADLEKRAKYVGNLVGGLSRFFYGAYWGLTADQPGACIDKGAFIPRATLYADAITMLNNALNFAGDAYDTKVVHSILAKIYLADAKYAEAATHAAQGLAEGDAPFNALYTPTSGAANQYWAQGYSRVQWTVSERMLNYVADNPEEANRVLFVKHKESNGKVFFKQAKYTLSESPISFVSWQEMALTLAECNLRGQGSGDALALVNNVRASHNISALNNVDLDAIYVERDKELCFTGTRLLDQRRFGKFNLSWAWLPLSSRERNANPNIN